MTPGRGPSLRRLGAPAMAVALLAAGGAARADGGATAGDVGAPPGARLAVTLVALHHFPAELAEAVADGLRRELVVDVRLHAPLPLPPSAYYPPRRRYRADRLIDHLAHALPDERILGLTDVDVSTTKGRYADWGVFGLGALDGRAAVLSSFRLRRGARDAAHLRRRVVDVAIHEIGHTLGLPHCDEPTCVMRDAEGSIASVDDSSGRLGPACRARADELHPVRPPPGTPAARSTGQR